MAGAELISAPAHTLSPVSGVVDVCQEDAAGHGLLYAWAWCLAVSTAISESVQFSLFFFFSPYSFGCNVPVLGWGKHMRKHELELLLRPQNGCLALTGKAACLGRAGGRWI